MKKLTTIIITTIAAVSLFAGCELDTNNLEVTPGATTATEGNSSVNWVGEECTGVMNGVCDAEAPSETDVSVDLDAVIEAQTTEWDIVMSGGQN